MSTNITEEFGSKMKTLQNIDFKVLFDSSQDFSYFSDVHSTLSYFKTCLTRILKDAATQHTSQNFSSGTSNSKELNCETFCKRYAFPVLPYFSLYEMLRNLLDNLSKVPNGYDEFINLFLDCLSLIIVFVDEITRIELPFKVAEVLYQLKDNNFSLQVFLMNVLCRTIIPICFGILTDKILHSLDEIPSIIILVLESVEDVSLHFQLIEILMVFKKDLWIDIMSVISYTDGVARVFATQLLFHYWPHLHPTTSSQHKINFTFVYKPISCQHPNCQSLPSMNMAATMILDAAYPTKISCKPPPLYLCNKCTQNACKEKQSWGYVDVIIPTDYIMYHCENKHCLAKNSVATVMLLGSKSTQSSQATFYSQIQKHNISWHYENQIVRYCEECYNNLSCGLGGLHLTVQLAPVVAWHQDVKENTNLIVDTVISLLSEDTGFTPLTNRNSFKTFMGSENFYMSGKDDKGITYGIYPCDGCMENIGCQSNPELLSHFGVWLLVSLCPPQEGIDHNIASQLIAAVLVWHKKTAWLSADKCGNRLENLKTSFLRQWIKDMYKYYFKNFLYCLIPNPPSECRVRGYWDAIYPLWFHYKNGLSFITSLATYSIISYELWECLIPCWMMALSQNLDFSDLKRIEKAISILFDKDISPFDFEPEAIFNFLLRNFKQTDLIYHENALEWLQILCEVNVYLPMSKLFEVISVCTAQLRFSFYMKQPEHFDSDKELKQEKYQLPHLTEEESQNLISKSSQQGVHSVADILGSMGIESFEVRRDSDFPNSLSASSLSESTKEIRRVSSNRASKRLKTVLKSKIPGSMCRRTTKISDDLSSSGRTSNQSSPSSKRFISPDRKSDACEERKTSPEWNAARVIACYVDILDVLHEQLLLQACPIHIGLSSVQSISIGQLLCDLLWQILENNEEGPSTEDQLSQCAMAELHFSQQFFEISAKLLKFILPQTLSKKSSRMNTWSASSDCASIESTCFFQKRDYRQLKLPLQLVYLYVKALEYYESDRIVIDHVIECIFLLSFHGEVCELLVEMGKPIAEELELKILIPSLWKHLDVARPDSSKNIVAVLFNVLNSFENAWVYLFRIIGSSFNGREPSDDDKSIETWNDEFETLDRIHALLMFTQYYKNDYISSRLPVSHTIAYVLCLLLAALNRHNSAVYIKAKFIISELSIENLQVAYNCLQFEFESSLKDRVFVISRLLQVHKLRPDSFALSFVRFSEIMNILAREAHAQRSVGVALPFPSNACSHKSQLTTGQNCYTRTSNYVTLNEWLHRANLLVEIDDEFNVRSNCAVSKDEQLDGADDREVDGSLTIERDNNRANDIATVNHVILAICMYMIGCEKEIQVKPKEFHTFFRQFQIWIGYNEHANYITHSSAELRRTTGIYTFLKNLPKILDSNLVLGNIIIPVTLSLLQVIVMKSSGARIQSFDPKRFELNLLSPVDQLAWLNTLQVLMYKYTFKDSMQLQQLNDLLGICMDTLQKEFHSCEKETFDGSAGKKVKKNDKMPPSAHSRKRVSDKLSRFSDPDEEQASTKNFSMSLNRLDDGGFQPFDISPTTSNRQDAAPITSGEDKPPSYEATVCDDGENIASIKATNSATQPQHPFNNPVQVMEVASVDSRAGGKTKEENDEINLSPINTRCIRCKGIKKEYAVETLSMCITNLCQFVRFNYSLAVPLLPKLLSQLALIAEPLCDEQNSDSLLASHATGQVVLVAKQSIRCIVHQLADRRIFSCLFLIPFPKGSNFLQVLVACLRDYHHFPCVQVLKYTLEDLLCDLKLQQIDLQCLLTNMATYLHHIRHEAPPRINWQPIANLFSNFFTELANHIAKQEEANCIDVVLQVMFHFFKAPILINAKALLLEPFSKILSASFAKCNFCVKLLYDLCEVSYNSFSKERDKMYLTRCLVSKLIGCLKMNFAMPTLNLLHLLHIVLLDGQSRLNSDSKELMESLTASCESPHRCFALDCMKHHLSDCLEVLGDGNFLSHLNNLGKTKQEVKIQSSNDRKGAHESDLKLAVAQITAALLHKYLIHSNQIHNLFKEPPAMQHNQKEYHECVGQIKKLCWVLLGTLSHLGLQKGSSKNLWYPIPFGEGATLASLVQFVLTDYLKQNKESKMNMTSLCYAFFLCQLWTVYSEQLSYFMPSVPQTGSSSNSLVFASYKPVSDYSAPLLEFWGRITPSMMALLDLEGMVSENLHRHIASLIECLQMYDSAILYKLFSLWSPMLEVGRGRESFEVGSKSHNQKVTSATENTDDAEQTEQLDYLPSGGVRATAESNACHVLEIVNSINKKLVELERGERLLCIV